jgi:replicative superfamily II helicase
MKKEHDYFRFPTHELVFIDTQKVTDLVVGFFLIDAFQYNGDLASHVVDEIELNGQGPVYCGSRRNCEYYANQAKARKIPCVIREI